MQVSCTLTLAGFRISEPVRASSIFHKNTANYSAFIEKVGPGGGGTICIYNDNKSSDNSNEVILERPSSSSAGLLGGLCPHGAVSEGFGACG